MLPPEGTYEYQLPGHLHPKILGEDITVGSPRSPFHLYISGDSGDEKKINIGDVPVRRLSVTKNEVENIGAG